MIGALDIRIGDVLTTEPSVAVLAQLDARGMAVERLDPRRAAWIVVESERVIEERRRAAQRELDALADWRQAG